MPELPEVEVTRQGIAPHVEGRFIEGVTIRNGALRWPVPRDLAHKLTGSIVKTVRRRGKFILFDCAGPSNKGTLIIHLGMTGTLRLVAQSALLRAHDHVDIHLGPMRLRFNDPRRFGAILWHDAEDPLPLDESRHLRGLGVEPLGGGFEGDLGGQILFERTRGRMVSVKQMLLSGQVVVGVGNIYASESLFRARINPKIAAGRVGLLRYQRLAEAVRATLAAAILKGGSTLRDFVGSDGQSGYFQLEYFVYDRAQLPCRVCRTPILALRQGQRSTFYCPKCQRC
jgi:formamidopyrimidine-DNA glycosylase